MSTQAQINANCRNAQKSTGPKTAEGKAIVAQNALKHGLFAQENVIKCEKLSDFYNFHEKLLSGLAPAGGVEAMLAERVVSLAWRLKCVERMTSEVIDVKIAEIETNPWEREQRSKAELLDMVTDESELALGWAMIKDFSGSNVLERLLMYEKRIESSLYKAMNELKGLQCMRKKEEMEEMDTLAIQPSLSLGHEAALPRGRDAQDTQGRDARATVAADADGEKVNCAKQSQCTAENDEPREYPGLPNNEKQTQSCFSAASADSAVHAKQSQSATSGRF